MGKRPQPIEKCRVSGSTHLVKVLSLGEQELTGVFPRSRDEKITSGPLDLVWCPASGLLQLSHSYDADEMYGANYGYRSGLNQAMIRHLATKSHRLEDVVRAACARRRPRHRQQRRHVAVVVSAPRLHPHRHRSHRRQVRALLPRARAAGRRTSSPRTIFRKVAGARQAKIVTSIAMFYDLERPMDFVRDVAAVLADDGIWHFEQSYLPSMLAATSYDTICHEHLEYYALRRSSGRILDRAGLRIVDVELNAVNGGSFAVTAAKRGGAAPEPCGYQLDPRAGGAARAGSPRPYRDFGSACSCTARISAACCVRWRRTADDDRLRRLDQGQCRPAVLRDHRTGSEAIAEVNEDKFGAFTPGTHIPIVSEAEARAMKPDYFLVLPWHFKEAIVQRESAFPGERRAHDLSVSGDRNRMNAPSYLKRGRPFVSYAGNLEDVMLTRAFPQAQGFFVDVGANDPVGASNTWALYQRGWSGVTVEPLPGACAKFMAKRPRDVCLNVAVGETDGEASFFVFGGGAGHSTCDRARAEELQRELGQPMTEIKVPVRTLASIVAEYAKGRDIDVVSIDAEGAEAAILRGAQLDRYRPKLIIIEAMAAFVQVDVSEEASKILEANSYVLAYEDGLNKFFVAKERGELLDALRYPPNLFDNYITVSELNLSRKSRLRLRLLQITLAAWAISVVALVLAFRG